MVEIYYDPHGETFREIARLCALLGERGARARDAEQARSILARLTEGQSLSDDDHRTLTRLRAAYGRARGPRGSSGEDIVRAIAPEDEAAQRWENEGGAVPPHGPATDPPVEA